MPDESLLATRYPIFIEPDGDDEGWIVQFDKCNHKVWFAVMPSNSQMYHCGACIHKFGAQLRREQGKSEQK
jgi:hypothetical protein